MSLVTSLRLPTISQLIAPRAGYLEGCWSVPVRGSLRLVAKSKAPFASALAAASMGSTSQGRQNRNVGLFAAPASRLRKGSRMQVQCSEFVSPNGQFTSAATSHAGSSQERNRFPSARVRPNPSVKRTLHGLPEFMRKKPRINSVNPFRAAYLTR